MCYGGILTILLPECHANQSTWSDIDKAEFDKVRQFILELVTSFGLQSTTILSLVDNLTWSEDGSPYFTTDYLHARNAFYTTQSLVAGTVPIFEYQRWWTMDLKERLHVYVDSNINKFAKNRSGPWKNLASDAPPEMCVALFFKVENVDHSDNKSDDRFEFEVRSDGIRLLNLSKYMNHHEAIDPSDFHHVSAARGGKIKWNSQLQNNPIPGLPQSEGHFGYAVSHLSCLDDNVTLLVPDTKPLIRNEAQHVGLHDAGRKVF